MKFLWTNFLLITSFIFAQIQTDIIKPIALTSGKTDSILISDLFYSKNYDVKFDKNEKVKIHYNKKSGMIKFTPNLDASGIYLIDFNLGKEKYSLITRTKKLKEFIFKFKPGKNYKTLTLFGSFNGWDRGNLPMKDENGDGIFEAKVFLEPGRYEYKFFGDGEEIVDPNNPNKKPNGFGDFNSIFNVEDDSDKKIFLHVDKFENIKKQNKQYENVFSFIYENQKDGNQITKQNIIALADNKKISTDKFFIKENKVELHLNDVELKKIHTIRIAIQKSGNATNIQSIFLKNGKIANNNNFLWNDAIIYSLMIDRFNDGDKSLNKPVIHDSLSPKANYMGGDFQGIINKLNDGYFNKLGVNTIWLSPVYDNPDKAYKESPAPHRWFSGYHGYWPINSFNTEEKFGSLEKLKELVSTAHKIGIKILLDVVANHVHEENPIFKEHKDWFGSLYLPDGRKNLRLWDEQRLTTWFEPYLPKFNYVNSNEAINFQVDNAIWWLKETNADGFRQDAVKHITNDFWRTLTKKLKNEIEIPFNKKVYQIGETFGSYELINSYVNNGQLTAQFNFNLYDVALPTFLDRKMSFKSLDAEIKKSFLIYGENNLMGNIMDSHDKNRFMAFADGDLDISQWSAIEEGWNNPPQVDNEISYKKAKLYYAYMNAIPGIPVIYYGSEFGMTGASDPDNRRMMKFDNELSDYEKQMLNDVGKIINLRKEHTALRYGDFLTINADKRIFAFVRSDFNERILVVLNKSLIPQTIKIDLPEFYKIKSVKNLLYNETNLVEGNKLKIKVNELSYNFYILE
ncbi:alpha-amylase family glycosyl hydrolase [Stygiobacter electus]|uniref:Alpha-amylase family glycosyl hydrolase n=1 Tax=Stygiobacter electus TaxID=3032292 RepID=A0AAE3NZN1_9BACT|nr:alpha-amylase family glycosyl hydrolase [Stygiobacter electus]MDF1611584.1 alpha-amylase family glycosyl hydrolase [Stygiobacter electus]